MSTGMDELTSAKPRKRTAAKAPVRQSSDKVKISLVLTADVDFKLSVHAAALRLDRSALANQVLGEALKRFVVQDRARPERTEEEIPA